MASAPPDVPPVAPLLLCPKCAVEMRLVGIEPEALERDLYTFECGTCARFEVRSALIAPL